MSGLCSQEEEKSFLDRQNVTLGDCENLLIEQGIRTIISNGKIIRFTYDR